MADPLTIEELARLRRFLVLGTDGGSYHVNAKDLTSRGSRAVLDLARTRTAELVREIVAVSLAGRAPRPHPTLFALAAACAIGERDGRRAALQALPVVARTGSQLFLFARYVERFRGWGRGLRRAVASWYLAQPVDDVACQAVTHRRHQGWSHRDLLRLAHPVTEDDARNRLFRWILGHDTAIGGPRIVEGYQRARAAAGAGEVAGLVTEYGLSWELVPHRHLDQPVVWEALLTRGMPPTALLRQLPRLTKLGLLPLLGARTATVAAQLTDPEWLRTGRVHPIDVLAAHRTYVSGRHGSQTWAPAQPIVDALDAGFHAALGTVEPVGRGLLLALDVSDSMTTRIRGMPLSCREASAALALVTAATEPRHEIVGFTRDPALAPLPIEPRRGLAHAIGTVSKQRDGRTDPARTIRHALDEGLRVDTFVVYTDNETWPGDPHPHEALRTYREKTGIDAKFVVVAMTATKISIAHWSDPGMLDVAGFDSAVPNLVSDFARGR